MFIHFLSLNREREDCKQYWRNSKEKDRIWMEQELPRLSIDDSKAEEVISQAMGGIASQFVAWVNEYWDQNQEILEGISKSEFLEETRKCWQYKKEPSVEYQVKQYLGQWMERRQVELTDAIENNMVDGSIHRSQIHECRAKLGPRHRNMQVGKAVDSHGRAEIVGNERNLV
jgi:Glu-tRNA(Gln) amidotransferase subunit E-like FAD-binding protein